MVYFIWCFCVFSETFMGLCQVSKMTIINITCFLPPFQPEEYCKSCFSCFGVLGIRGQQTNHKVLKYIDRFSPFLSFPSFLEFCSCFRQISHFNRIALPIPIIFCVLHCVS